jgi:hypothetical protein
MLLFIHPTSEKWSTCLVAGAEVLEISGEQLGVEHCPL